MEYLINDSPSILIEKETGKAYPFSAEEEVFVVINSSSREMISFDFEKRKLSARCIVRLIDYDKCAISEVSAVTPKFNIKSTFAPKPYGDSDITFLGGGFTASAVSRNGRIGIIASVPEIKLPSGGKGLKVEAFLTNDEKDKSFNCLLSYDKKTESLHASIAKEITGTIWIGEEKTEIVGDNLQGRHIWKRTSFPKRKEKPVGIIYGKANKKPFSSVVLTYDDSLTLNTEGVMKRYKKVQWVNAGNNVLNITNGENINIKAEIFSSIHEKQRPFRKARTFRYAIFSGTMDDKIIDEAIGYLEYPDRV